MLPPVFRLLTGLILLLLLSCRQGYEIRESEHSFLKPSVSGSGIAIDSGSLKISDPYRVEMTGKMNRVLARSAQPMEKGQPESELGNFVADLCLLIANRNLESQSLPGADFCVLNNGGLRSSLPEGDVLLRHAFELMPFDNELVVIEMDGKQIGKILDYIADKGGVPVSGLRMSISGGVPGEVFIGGQSFDSSKTYRVLTSDFLAGGGDSMSMFTESKSALNTGIKVREAIIMFLEESGQQKRLITAKKDGRIYK